MKFALIINGLIYASALVWIGMSYPQLTPAPEVTPYVTPEVIPEAIDFVPVIQTPFELEPIFQHPSPMGLLGPTSDFAAQKVSNGYKINKIALISESKLNDRLSGVLSNKGYLFIRVGRANKVDPLFLASVAIHESGNGTSLMARNKNNVCGIYNSRIRDYQSFKSVDECIRYTGELLANYVTQHKDTIERVQRSYCPIGADNDPKQLNGLWLSGVQKWMERIAGVDVMFSNEQSDNLALNNL